MKNTIKAILCVQMTAMLLTAALSNSVAAGAEIPFKGSLKGDFTLTPLAPPLAAVLIEATGNATLLGGFTVEIPHLVSFATATGIGTYEFTAANGDTLTADFTGAAIPTETPDVVSIVETATITRGTGRFEGATGSFITVRWANLVTGLTSGSFNGTILLGKKK